MRTLNIYYEDPSRFRAFVRQHEHILFSEKNTALLVQIFCGQNDPAFFKKIAESITTELPSATVIGATASGEIMNGEVSGLKTVLSISVFQNTTLQASLFHKNSEDDFEFGRHIAATLSSNQSKVLILFGAGSMIMADQVLAGISAQSPNLLIAGGNAGNNTLTSPPWVSLNQETLTCGFVAVVLESEKLDARLYSHIGWQAIGKEMTITKAEGKRVYTINNIPAYQVYRRYLGIDKASNFLNSVEFPLIVNRNGTLIARTPRNCQVDDSIEFFGDVHEGEKVRLSFGDAGLISEMIELLSKKIQKNPAESIFVYSCESRRGFLQDLSDIETRPLQKIASTSGLFTAGEYYHSRGANQLLNATMTVLVLSESEEPLSPFDEADFEYTSSDLAEIPSDADRVSERRTGVLKALTHLINTVTAELEAVNQDLNYIGLHDSLTGAYNRTFFDQEINRLEKQSDSVGILICDMDCLKLVNDTLGHEVGDRTIRSVAQLLMESCRNEDFVARIGGDEFAILVRGASKSDLAAIATRIEEHAQELRTCCDDNLAYLSIGYAYRELGSSQNLSEIFTNADNAMYQNKSKFKEQIRNEIIARFAKNKR